MPENGNFAGLLLDQSPSCSWAVRADGVFHQFYGDCSDILGKPCAQLVGHPVTEALDPKRARIWTPRFSRALRGETVSLRQQTGDSVWSVSVFPMRVDGEIRYAGALAR